MFEKKVDNNTLAFTILGSNRQIAFGGTMEFKRGEKFILKSDSLEASCVVEVESVEYKQVADVDQIDAMRSGYTDEQDFYSWLADEKFVTLVQIFAVKHAS